MGLNVEKSNRCESCPFWTYVKEKSLRECDSVFDAVIEVNQFVEKCKNTCVKKSLMNV